MKNGKSHHHSQFTETCFNCSQDFILRHAFLGPSTRWTSRGSGYSNILTIIFVISGSTQIPLQLSHWRRVPFFDDLNDHVSHSLKNILDCQVFHVSRDISFVETTETLTVETISLLFGGEVRIAYYKKLVILSTRSGTLPDVMSLNIVVRFTSHLFSCS